MRYPARRRHVTGSHGPKRMTYPERTVRQALRWLRSERQGCAQHARDLAAGRIEMVELPDVDPERVAELVAELRRQR